MKNVASITLCTLENGVLLSKFFQNSKISSMKKLKKCARLIIFLLCCTPSCQEGSSLKKGEKFTPPIWLKCPMIICNIATSRIITHYIIDYS